MCRFLNNAKITGSIKLKFKIQVLPNSGSIIEIGFYLSQNSKQISYGSHLKIM